jgi:hypothetical protein
MKRYKTVAKIILYLVLTTLLFSSPLLAMGSNADLEERVARLEALLEEKTARYDRELAEARLEIERAQAAVEIQSVLGRYAFYYSAQRFELIKELWSEKEDATFDRILGIEMVNEEGHQFGTQTVGLFRIHTLTTPVIEVAADGQTARAIFFSPGVDTNPRQDGTVTASWCWIKYGADFIREGGKWKIWHLSAYGLFNSDYYTSWADKEVGPLRRTFPDGSQSARDDWNYAKDRLPVLEPVPPEPYETWEDVGNGYRTW